MRPGLPDIVDGEGKTGLSILTHPPLLIFETPMSDVTALPGVLAGAQAQLALQIVRPIARGRSRPSGKRFTESFPDPRTFEDWSRFGAPSGIHHQGISLSAWPRQFLKYLGEDAHLGPAAKRLYRVL